MPAHVPGSLRVGLDGPDGFVCFLGCSTSDIRLAGDHKNLKNWVTL